MNFGIEISQVPKLHKKARFLKERQTRFSPFLLISINSFALLILKIFKSDGPSKVILMYELNIRI